MKSTEFKKTVTEELAPFLREKGWKGTGFNYTKHIGNILRALTIQPSSSGGKFCIEIGIHFDFIPLKPEKELSKIKTWDLDIRTRLTPNDESDYWWDFPKNNRKSAKLFSELKNLILNSGENYFHLYDNWEDTVSKFTTENIENGDTKALFNITSLRKALLIARINLHLDNNEKAIEFSEYGLSKIKGVKGSGLIPDFEDIINKSR